MNLRILQAGAVSAAVLCAGKLANVGGRLLLARWLLPEEFGGFCVAAAVVALASMLAGLGMTQSIVRDYPVLRGRGDSAALRGLLLFPGLVALAAGAVLAGTLLLARLCGLADVAPSLNNRCLLLALAAIPAHALLIVLPGGLLAQGRSLAYLFASQLLFSGLFLCAAPAAWAVSDALTLPGLLQVHLLTSWVAAGVLAIGTATSLGRTAVHVSRAGLKPPPWRFYRHSLLLLASGVSYVALVSTDRIVLGWFVAADQVALYSVAFTIASALPCLLLLADAHATPRLATAFARQDLPTAAAVFQRSNQLLLYAATGVVALIWLFQRPLLELFGPAYGAAGVILSLLLMGEYVNVVLGTSGRLLQIAGRAGDDARLALTAAGMNVVLNLVLIPLWGVTGAVAATVAARLLLTLSKAWLVYRRLGIVPYGWGRRRRLALAAGTAILLLCWPSMPCRELPLCRSAKWVAPERPNAEDCAAERHAGRSLQV